MDVSDQHGNSSEHEKGGGTTAIDVAAKDNARLLRSLATGTVGLIRSRETPAPIKAALIPLLVQYAAFGSGIVVFIGNAAISLAKDQPLQVEFYLGFFAVLAVMSSLNSLVYMHMTSRYQNTEELSQQLATVTKARQPRRRPRSPSLRNA